MATAQTARGKPVHVVYFTPLGSDTGWWPAPENIFQGASFRQVLRTEHGVIYELGGLEGDERELITGTGTTE